MILYSCALVFALLVSAPVWGWRMVRQGRYRTGLRERLGEVPARLKLFVQGRPVVWVHAVSVGEALAASRLVADLEAALPGYAVVVSTTTPTGQAIARERYGVDRVFFYPLDLAFAVRAYLRVLRPSLVILMESELWPRVLVECSRAGVPVAVVNARVSDRSLPRYLALSVLWKPLLQRVRLLLAQSDLDAVRWRRIGAAAQRVLTTGNLKFDVHVAEASPLADLLRRHMAANTGVLVCGSTHAGEEQMLLDAWTTLFSGSRVMVLAPRHPERVDEVEALCTERDFPVYRLSAWRMQPVDLQPGSVLLVDTVGELASLYSIANAAFVGGSLVASGGHNPLEPAQFALPIVMGPHFENFRGIVDGMLQQEAIVLTSAEHLWTDLDHAFSDSARGARAKSVFASQAGATARTVAALLPLLQEKAR